jgi:hypothetical protein
MKLVRVLPSRKTNTSPRYMWGRLRRDYGAILVLKIDELCNESYLELVVVLLHVLKSSFEDSAFLVSLGSNGLRKRTDAK